MPRTAVILFLAFSCAVALAASPPRLTVVQRTVSDTDPLQRLADATKTLQQSVGALTRASSQSARERAIKETNQILLDVREKLRNLPFDLVASVPNEGRYDDDERKLQEAARTLREAIRVLASEPASQVRDTAMKDANDALVAAQETMMNVPAPMV